MLIETLIAPRSKSHKHKKSKKKKHKKEKKRKREKEREGERNTLKIAESERNVMLDVIFILS